MNSHPIAAVAIVLAAVFFQSRPSSAQHYEAKELQYIVAAVCGTEAPLIGSEDRITGDVEGTIRLSRLAKLLTEAGLTGEFAVESEDFTGLTQEALPLDRSDRRKCGLSIAQMLFSQTDTLLRGEGRVEVVAHGQEVRDQTTAVVCGINAYFEFHHISGKSPRSLTLASPATGRTVVSVGEMKPIGQDCHVEILEFRYFGDRDYGAVVRQVYF